MAGAKRPCSPSNPRQEQPAEPELPRPERQVAGTDESSGRQSYKERCVQYRRRARLSGTLARKEALKKKGKQEKKATQHWSTPPRRPRQHLLHGYVDPPMTGTTKASCTGTTKADTANSFFADVWNHGQPFADDDLQAVTVGSTEYGGEIVVAGPCVVNSCAEWVTGVGATTPYTEALSGDIRWIPEEPLVDLYEQLRTWCGQTEAECPSYSTMYRAWTETWSHRIHYDATIATIGMHMGKCDDCERFKQLRRLATSPEDHARIRIPEDAHSLVGCSKCPKNPRGCSECRTKLGLKLQPDGSWIW